MTDSSLNERELTEFEALIDKHGIENVLIALCEIADLKSEHIITNWQDLKLAKRWATVAGALGTTVTKATGL